MLLSKMVKITARVTAEPSAVRSALFARSLLRTSAGIMWDRRPSGRAMWGRLPVTLFCF